MLSNAVQFTITVIGGTYQPCKVIRRGQASQDAVERDALGELPVPAEALYGIHTVRALENLAFSSRRLGSCPPYVWALGAVLQRGPLYRYADPLGALNLAVMTDGDELQWHFDQTDFVVSLALQDADEGGDFEVVPHIRSASDERYDAVKRLFEGARDTVVRLPMRPGTLLIFEGRYSIHRVSPIHGTTPRHVALLAYDTKPGTCSTEVLRLSRYGRVG